MQNRPANPTQKPQGPAPKGSKKDKLAKALKQNLLRRKQAASPSGDR